MPKFISDLSNLRHANGQTCQPIITVVAFLYGFHGLYINLISNVQNLIEIANWQIVSCHKEIQQQTGNTYTLKTLAQRRCDITTETSPNLLLVKRSAITTVLSVDYEPSVHCNVRNAMPRRQDQKLKLLKADEHGSKNSKTKREIQKREEQHVHLNAWRNGLPQ